MTRKWFQFVGEDGSPVTSVDIANVDIEDVDSLRDSVKKEYNDSFLAGIASSDLTVFENGALTEALEADASIESFGGSMSNALVVQVPARHQVEMDGQPPHKKARSWTIIPNETIESVELNLNIDSWSVGGIDLNINKVEPDFPEWFYVRKEVLDIFEVFETQLRAGRNVVFVGTPGVGKSMLVVLFAFYMALVEIKRVVLFRKQKAVQPVGYSMLYLDAQSKPPVFWRKDAADFSDLEHFGRDNELCLDGFGYDDVQNHFGKMGRFRLLAPSAQYKMKDDDVNLMQCLVPFWSFSDLEKIGKYREWPGQDITGRYFYSGGNLRAFSLPEDQLKINTDQAVRVVNLNIATLLSTRYGGGAGYQVDRLRMTGINRSDLKQDTNAYLDCSKWLYVITSEYALRELSKIVTPSYYLELWGRAFELGDDGLKGIAFENYVHASARDGTKMELRVREYNQKKVTSEYSYKKVNLEPNQCRNDGKDAAGCDTSMEEFASSSDDYWYPLFRSLKSIDCVAKLKLDGLFKEGVGLFQITKSNKHTIDSEAIDKYAGIFPNGCSYIALVPCKKTADAFQLVPVDPATKVPLRVAYLKNFPSGSSF